MYLLAVLIAICLGCFMLIEGVALSPEVGISQCLVHASREYLLRVFVCVVFFGVWVQCYCFGVSCCCLLYMHTVGWLLGICLVFLIWIIMRWFGIIVLLFSLVSVFSTVRSGLLLVG